MGRIEKIGFYLTLFLMGVFFIYIIFSTPGIKDYRQLSQQNVTVMSQIDVVTQENQQIENQIMRLKQDIEYIRHLAKHEQGMAEPDELIFKLKN